MTVAEVSSFQLETIETFHPRASAITNITEDHLNRHHTMDEYIRVKERITENQTMDDVCVLNYEDEILRAFGEKLIREQKVRVSFSPVRGSWRKAFTTGTEKFICPVTGRKSWLCGPMI